jgi:hypothetical protein
MGVAMFIVLEHRESDAYRLALDMAGKPLAHVLDELRPVIKKRGVKDPCDFFSGDPDEMSAFAEVPPGVEEEWFSPAEGLKTFRAMLEIARDKKQFEGWSRREDVIADLVAIETILVVADAEENRFHVALDI